MIEIIRAVVESYDEANHLANVRPRRNPASLYEGVAVARNCPGELIDDDDDVALLVWGDEGGLVLGPYNGAWDWPVRAWAYRDEEDPFTAQEYTQIPSMSVSLTLRETSHIWVMSVFNHRHDRTRGNAAYVRVFINGAGTRIVAMCGHAAANLFRSSTLCGRSEGTYGPGTYNVDLRVYVVYAGDTFKTNRCTMCAWATGSGPA